MKSNVNSESPSIDSKGIELKPLVNSFHIETPTSTTHNVTTNTNTSTNSTTSPTSHTGHNEFGSPGSASQKQVTVNIFISFVGSGMLGMPYAFKQSGWVLGCICLCLISSLNVYAMNLLIQTRKKLESNGFKDINGYGCVGRVVSGDRGEKLVNVCLVISQIGFSTAYLIFIAANLNNIWGVNRAYVCFGCVPILAVLVQLQDMKHLSPFSLLADIANLAGLIAVMVQDWKAYESYHEKTIEFDFRNILYVSSVALYSLEGVGMVLPLESSCMDRSWFPSLLQKTIFAITMLMCIFGTFGYFAFGNETEAPVTLNLDGITANIVKVALCLGLYLTYPIMMFPINQVMENLVLGHSSPDPHRVFRSFVVFLSALVAFVIPDFGKFLSLVGASICVVLGFILPGYFHLMSFERNELLFWEWIMDYFLMIFGVLFAIIGTSTSIGNLMSGVQDTE